MIYLIAYKVLISPSGRKTNVLIKFKDDIKKIKWSNNFDEFNIFSPLAWRDYLANKYRLPDGKKLPNKTKDGDRIVYYVYVYGSSKLMQEYFNKKGGRGNQGGSYLPLFPGMDKGGNKRDVIRYGWIRKVK